MIPAAGHLVFVAIAALLSAAALLSLPAFAGVFTSTPAAGGAIRLRRRVMHAVFATLLLFLYSAASARAVQERSPQRTRAHPRVATTANCSHRSPPSARTSGSMINATSVKAVP